MKEWNYTLTIEHRDGNWKHEDGTPVVLETETYRSDTEEGIIRQYKKHNYHGYTKDLNCVYFINGMGFTIDEDRNKIYFECI